MDYEERKKTIAERIKAERKKKGLKRPALLGKIYMSPSSGKTLDAWERGERIPDLKSLALMAEVFDCDIGYLLGDYSERKRDYHDIRQFIDISEEAAANLIKFGEIETFRNGLNLLLEEYYHLQSILSAVALCHNYSTMTNLEREYMRQGITTDNMTLYQKTAIISDRTKYREALLANASFRLQFLMNSLIEQSTSDNGMHNDLFEEDENGQSARAPR